MSFKPFMVNLDEANVPQVGEFSAFDVNASRPYRGDKRNDLAYITRVIGVNEDGTPKHEAQLVGAANTSTLFKDEWKMIDEAINTARNKRMAFVNWLISKGCVIDIPNGLGVTQYEWQNLTGLAGADLSMDGLKQGDTDRVEYSSASIPLPIISKNWRLNLRFLEESRRKGMPMDSYFTAETARVVAEYAENMAVNGAKRLKFGGDALYGLLDSPNVEALTADTLFTKDWAAAATTGAEILADVLGMVQELNDNKRFGPFALWLPQIYQGALARDYTDGYPKTIAQRLMETGMLESINYSDFIGKDFNDKYRVVLMEPAKECIAIIRGMEFRDFEWNAYGGWVNEHKVAGIYVPLIRKDAGGETGIVKATLT